MLANNVHFNALELLKQPVSQPVGKQLSEVVSARHQPFYRLETHDLMT